MKNSRIAWTHHTKNFWRGCKKVAPECAFCYAERGALRNPAVLGVWGDAPRVIASRAQFLECLEWNENCLRRGVRERVFVMSLGDFLEDRPELVEPRQRACEVMQRCPQLDFLMLTKRPENAPLLLPSEWLRGWWPDNVWFGVSAGTTDTLVQMWPAAQVIPAPVHFISCEPMLESIDFESHGVLTGTRPADWLIMGCESRAGKRLGRPMRVGWVEKAIYQRQRSGSKTMLFVKQIDVGGRVSDDPTEWPKRLRVREVPGDPLYHD